MSARTIIAAPVIWFGSWLLSLMVFVLFVQLLVFASGNKKVPLEAPCAPSVSGWQSATPGGAPGYDDDKEVGNNIAHLAAQASQRLREHSGEAGKVKPNHPVSAILTP